MVVVAGSRADGLAGLKGREGLIGWRGDGRLGKEGGSRSCSCR